MCSFFVVPGNGQALLGLADIEILNILSVSWNIICTEKADKDAHCSTNTPVTHDAGSEQCYANTGPETVEPEKSLQTHSN